MKKALKKLVEFAMTTKMLFYLVKGILEWFSEIYGLVGVAGMAAGLFSANEVALDLGFLSCAASLWLHITVITMDVAYERGS